MTTYRWQDPKPPAAEAVAVRRGRREAADIDREWMQAGGWAAERGWGAKRFSALIGSGLRRPLPQSAAQSVQAPGTGSQSAHSLPFLLNKRFDRT